MICAWLGLILRFVSRSFSRATMGCFFACFRVRDSRHLPTTTTTTSVSSSRPSKPNDVVVSRNRLSTLFLCEEREDSARSEGKNVGMTSQSDDKGLKDEATFLKACGTLERTPREIRKISEKLKVSPSCGKDSEPSRFHSGLPNTTGNKVQLDDQPFNPLTPVKCSEKWRKRTNSLEHTPTSCISSAQNTQCDSLNSTEGSKTRSLHTSDRTENKASGSPWRSVSYATRRNNSSNDDSFNHDGWHLKKTESPNNEGAYKPSPYPTSLRLPDDMQTPGIVCLQTSDDLPNGKPTQGLKDVSCENESHVEGSLSSWLKPASAILEERNKRMEMTYGQMRKTPADRPIIGMVAAHWNEDEDSHVPPPKWWDGNGIPNSTNKYKEDQKVNWHATPFEERLEKALSEESSISQRKDFCGKPVAFNEHEENDTAISQMRSSPHPQSVVSF